MSELKAISGHEIREDIDYNTRGVDPEDKEWHNYGKELCNTLYYLKSEADKAIDDLEESHKKEVGQLLMEIEELKNEIEEQKRLRDMALASVPNVLKVMKIIQHHKYKRCLAMADMCNAKYDEEDAKVNGCGASWEYISKVMKFWERWSKRWLEIAEKFKETK